MVRLAGVKAVRYIGKAPKKLWEVGGRNVPILNRGDVVLVGETVALSLTRGRFFIPVEGEITMDIPELPTVETSDDLSSDENPPADLEAKALEEANTLAGTEPLNDIDLDTAFDAPAVETEPEKKKGK